MSFTSMLDANVCMEVLLYEYFLVFKAFVCVKICVVHDQAYCDMKLVMNDDLRERLIDYKATVIDRTPLRIFYGNDIRYRLGIVKMNIR